MMRPSTRTFVFTLFTLLLAPQMSFADESTVVPLIHQRHSQLTQLQNSYWIQLLNQDMVSTPQLEARLTSLYEELEFLRAEAEDREENSIPPWPPIHPDVAVRTGYIRNQVVNSVRSQLRASSPLPMEFRSVTPAPPGAENRSGYPRESSNSPAIHNCLTGGFVTQSEQPNLEGLQRNASLLNNFARWTDRICSTPESVRLQLNGQSFDLSCNPGGLEQQNLNNAIQAMEMCDPLLYGFFPRSLNTENRILSLCRFPNQMIIGQSQTYDSQFAGPNSSNPSGYQSHCDVMSRAQIGHLFTPPEGIEEDDAGLVLAARLALENPRVFAQKRQRLNNRCQSLEADARQASLCRNLLHRLSEVERVREVLRQQPRILQDQENETRR